MRRWFWLFMSAAATCAFTGCVGVVPIPVASRTPAYGTKVDHARTRFIRPGQTTRAEVVAGLGTNHVTFPNSRVVAYTWEMRGGGCIWWAAAASLNGGGATGGSVDGGWRSFLVAFDERDIVRAAEFKRLSASLSLDSNIDRWVADLPAPGSPASLPP